MEVLKKSLGASFMVQMILVGILLGSSLLGAEQSAWVLLFPFVAGVPIGPLLLRPLLGTMPPDLLMNVGMAAAMVSNFVVYSTIFYGWFMVRDKFSAGKNLPTVA